MSGFSSMPAAPQGETRRSLTSGLAGYLQRAWQSYLTRRLEQAAIVALGSMSDRELRDIGITRSQIETAVKMEVARHHSHRRFV